MTTKDTSVKEINYETRDYDGIRWIRYDHYEHALQAERQKQDDLLEKWRKSIDDEAASCTIKMNEAVEAKLQRCEEMVESLRKDEVKWKKAKYDVKSVEAVIYNRALDDVLDDVLQALTQPNDK